MKYPKPGYPNPLVTLHVFDIDDEFTTPVELTWDGRLPINDSIITEVVWVSPMELMIKETNRAATTGQVVLFDISKIEVGQLHGGNGARGKIVRKLGRDGEEGDEGWIDQVRGFVVATCS
jgi:dipeptidyl aminopeptidase